MGEIRDLIQRADPPSLVDANEELPFAVTNLVDSVSHPQISACPQLSLHALRKIQTFSTSHLLSAMIPPIMKKLTLSTLALRLMVCGAGSSAAAAQALAGFSR